MRGKLNKKAILSLNLYMLAEILVSFSEDVTFIKQIFDSVSKSQKCVCIVYGVI